MNHQMLKCLHTNEHKPKRNSPERTALMAARRKAQRERIPTKEFKVRSKY